MVTTRAASSRSRGSNADEESHIESETMDSGDHGSRATSEGSAAGTEDAGRGGSQGLTPAVAGNTNAAPAVTVNRTAAGAAPVQSARAAPATAPAQSARAAKAPSRAQTKARAQPSVGSLQALVATVAAPPPAAANPADGVLNDGSGQNGADDVGLEIDNLDARLQLLESQRATDRVHIETLQRKVKRLETGTSRDGGRQRDRESGQWTWKVLRNIGEEIFAILKDPASHAEFAAFVLRGLDDLAEVPPLQHRIKCLRHQPATKHAYNELIRVLAGSGTYDQRLLGLTVAELMAVFMVARDDFSPISLRTYLAIAGIEVERARSLPENSFKEVRVRSSVSDYLRTTVRDALFYIDRPMDLEWAIGEKIKSSGAYHAMLQTLPRRDAAPTSLTQLSQSHRSVTEIASAATRPATRFSHVRTQNSRFTGNKVRVAGRCMKCGRNGHKIADCQGGHPLFRENEPFWLLNEISHGRIPAP